MTLKIPTIFEQPFPSVRRSPSTEEIEAWRDCLNQLKVEKELPSFQIDAKQVLLEVEKQLLYEKFPNDPRYMSLEEERKYWQQIGREFLKDLENFSLKEKPGDP